MADWEHKDATWFWDLARSIPKRNQILHKMTLDFRRWLTHRRQNWHLELSPDANESQKESFNAEVEKINKEFSEILPTVEISEWLNLQTKGGWEVFKISRRVWNLVCFQKKQNDSMSISESKGHAQTH